MEDILPPIENNNVYQSIKQFSNVEIVNELRSRSWQYTKKKRKTIAFICLLIAFFFSLKVAYTSFYGIILDKSDEMKEEKKILRNNKDVENTNYIESESDETKKEDKKENSNFESSQGDSTNTISNQETTKTMENDKLEQNNNGK